MTKFRIEEWDDAYGSTFYRVYERHRWFFWRWRLIGKTLSHLEALRHVQSQAKEPFCKEIRYFDHHGRERTASWL